MEMDSFVPLEKRSKKEQQKIHQKRRSHWHGVNPLTKRVESKKVYTRKKTRQAVHPDEHTAGSLPVLPAV